MPVTIKPGMNILDVSMSPKLRGVVLTIDDSAKVPASQAYFPVMIHLGSQSGVNKFNTQRILATPWQNLEILADGVECYAEVEQWTPSNGILWVRAPNLTYNTTVVLNTLDSPNTQYVGLIGSVAGKTVWSNNFVAVYHGADDLYKAPYLFRDSTANGHHGTPHIYSDKYAGQTYKKTSGDTPHWSYPDHFEWEMYPWPDLVHPGGYPGSKGAPGYPELVGGLAGGYATYFDAVTHHCSYNVIDLGTHADFSRNTHPGQRMHLSLWMNHGRGLYTPNHMDYPNVQNPGVSPNPNYLVGNRVRFMYKSINMSDSSAQGEFLVPVQNYWYNTQGYVEGGATFYAIPQSGSGYGCYAQPELYQPGNWNFFNVAFGNDYEGYFAYANIPPWWKADGWGSGTTWNEDGNTIKNIEGHPYPAKPWPWAYSKRTGGADRVNGQGYARGQTSGEYYRWVPHTGNLIIGSSSWLSNQTAYTGAVDEMRWSKGIRSEQWQITDYYSCKDEMFTYAEVL